MSEFFEMGGHGLYVWPAYALSILVVSSLVIGRSLKLQRLQKSQVETNGALPSPGPNDQGNV